MNCFARFYSPEKRDKHFEICQKNSPCVVSLPDPKDNRMLEFKNTDNMTRIPIIGFLDYEAKNVPEVCGECRNSQCCCSCPCDEMCKCNKDSPCYKRLCPCATSKKCKIINHQLPVTYSILFVNTLSNRVIFERTFSSDDDPTNDLLEYLEKNERQILLRAYMDVGMTFSEQDLRNFRAASNCYLCHKPFSPEVRKVRDHCHSR